MRLRICSWVTKFSDDFDDGALSALGGHAWRRKEIDAFLLIQRPNDNLKLWIGEHARQSKDSRGHASSLPEAWHQKGVERVRGNRKIAAAVSACSRILSNGLPRGRINERKIRRVHGCLISRRSTRTENLPVKAKWAQEPIEAKFLEIILINLNKLRFN